MKDLIDIPRLQSLLDTLDAFTGQLFTEPPDEERFVQQVRVIKINDGIAVTVNDG